MVAAAAYVGQYQRELRLDSVLAERIGYGLALAVVVAAWYRFAGARSARAGHGPPSGAAFPRRSRPRSSAARLLTPDGARPGAGLTLRTVTTPWDTTVDPIPVADTVER